MADELIEKSGDMLTVTEAIAPVFFAKPFKLIDVLDRGETIDDSVRYVVLIQFFAQSSVKAFLFPRWVIEWSMLSKMSIGQMFVFTIVGGKLYMQYA